MTDRQAIIAGCVAGAAVSGIFIFLEVRKLQQPAFAASAQVRVAAVAERAVMQHLAEGYGLSRDRIAALQRFSRVFQTPSR